jgi:hypothetical protein
MDLPPITSAMSSESSPSNHLLGLSSILLQFTADLKPWSSKFVVLHGDKLLDISSASLGSESIIACGIHPQKLPYPQILYCFDDNHFFTIDSEDKMISMIKSPTTIDGCKLVTNQSKVKISNYRKKTLTFLCSHGKVMKVSDDFQFHPDNVGKSNVSIKRLKQTSQKVAL